MSKDIHYQIDIKKRDEICRLLIQSYTLPDKYRHAVGKGIRSSMNANLKEVTIQKYIESEQCLLQNVYSMKTSLAQWEGFVNEWICCLEYNSLKNRGNVELTIVNPDPTSKTDLLHIIKSKDGSYFTKPGGDVKSGSPEYVLSQYERALKQKGDTPFIDYSGFLTENYEKLTPKQKERFEALRKKYPRRVPIQPIFKGEDRIMLRRDIIRYLATGSLPSQTGDVNFKIPKERDQVIRLHEKIKSNLPFSNGTLYWNKLSVNLKKGNESEQGTESKIHRTKNKNKSKDKAKVYIFNKYGTDKQTYVLEDKSDFKIYKSNNNNQFKYIAGQIGKGAISLLKEGLKGVGQAYFQKKMDDVLNSFGKQNKQLTQRGKNSIKLEERKSPQKHNVRGHTRKQNGKEIHVKSYHRGKDN